MAEIVPDQLRDIPEGQTPSPFVQTSDLPTRLFFDRQSVLSISIAEILALVSLVGLSDLALYRSKGFMGPAVVFLVAPWLLALGKLRVKWDRSLWPLAFVLLLVAVRLAWCGSSLAVVVGFVVLCCAAMALSGLRPYLTRTAAFAFNLIPRGLFSLFDYACLCLRFSPPIVLTHWLAIILPVVSLLTFASIFTLANPDLFKSISDHLNWFVKSFEDWLIQIQFLEILFCLGTGWIAIGFLRPARPPARTFESMHESVRETSMSPFYAAYRNTLAVVIGLFAIYLVFEFQTLWFRSFPQGFYYSGYAHEGAAWLTVALGLATIMLSLIFRGSILADPRLTKLKSLSWIWSVLNLLLAVAVVNRLFIYIGFNGMTRMRVVGMLGVASVIGGFILVLRKIARNHDFTWLIRHQIGTVGIAIYLYAVFPVDGFVNRFNVNRILAGDPRPSVQISVHPTSDEGWLCLSPLIDCTDPTIRDGVRGLLDEKLTELERNNGNARDGDWTIRQIAFDRLIDQLRSIKSERTGDPLWNTADETARHLDIVKFRKYAYQWY